MSTLGGAAQSDYGTSGELIKKLMTGEMPGIADIGWAVVHVKDVAKAHVDALEAEGVSGQRFVCAIEHASMADIAGILKNNYKDQGYKIPKFKIPGIVLSMASIFDPTIKLAVGELGLRQDLSNKKIKSMLGFKSRSLESMVVEMAQSMIKYEVV